MNFMDMSIRFQIKVSEENPGAASNIAPEERPNHPHLEQMQVVLYSRPSDVITGKQAGTAQDALRKALVTVERHVPQDGKTSKSIFDHQPSPTCRQAIWRTWESWSARFTMKGSSKIAYTRGKSYQRITGDFKSK